MINSIQKHTNKVSGITYDHVKNTVMTVSYDKTINGYDLVI